jgi:hypothetical protein
MVKASLGGINLLGRYITLKYGKANAKRLIQKISEKVVYLLESACRALIPLRPIDVIIALSRMYTISPNHGKDLCKRS